MKKNIRQISAALVGIGIVFTLFLIVYKVRDTNAHLDTFSAGTNDSMRDEISDHTEETFQDAAWNPHEYEKIYDAAHYGIHTENTGRENSQILQELINTVADAGGGTVYIPAGTYTFAANGSQKIGNHCIKLKSNVSIKGDGKTTILLPTGDTENGLDMFYFNDFADTGNRTYLENCIFSDFVIDGKNSSSAVYTSAGKGFMINLLRNCEFHNITVKNTDGSGIGIDCPIHCRIVNCVAENCGKGAETSDYGASGFGIGFGMSAEETIEIMYCRASGNKNFGFFFEHQKRFDPESYTAAENGGLFAEACIAEENYCNFGSVLGVHVQYKNCVSRLAERHGYYLENSENCIVEACTSSNEGNSSFSIFASDMSETDGGKRKTNYYIGCISEDTPYGCKLTGEGVLSMESIVRDCFFDGTQENSIVTSGAMQRLVLEGNIANGAENDFRAAIINFVNQGNSWN